MIEEETKDHKISHKAGEAVKVSHLVTLGDDGSEMFCVRFSNEDKYVATGKKVSPKVAGTGK